jgi:tRNA G18 (ribose-2'-O)-methylase SpoU
VENDDGFFIAEGPLVVRTLLATTNRVRSVLVTPPQLEALTDVLGTIEAPIYVVAPDVMRSTVGFDLHRGAVAAADRYDLPSVAHVLAGARRVAVLERVNDHENLGALFRNAAALGIDAVLLGDRCADPLYRRSVRVSMGHVLRIPFAPLAPWPDALGQLRAAGFALLALTPKDPAVPLGDLDPTRLARTAVLLGAEGPGLTDAALAAADLRIRIPMAAGVDSLNIATAAAIAFHHLRG